MSNSVDIHKLVEAAEKVQFCITNLYDVDAFLERSRWSMNEILKHEVSNDDLAILAEGYEQDPDLMHEALLEKKLIASDGPSRKQKLLHVFKEALAHSHQNVTLPELRQTLQLILVSVACREKIQTLHIDDGIVQDALHEFTNECIYDAALDALEEFDISIHDDVLDSVVLALQKKWAMPKQ